MPALPETPPATTAIVRREPARLALRWSGDAVALTLLLAVIAVTVGFRFIYDNWLAQLDILGYFLPHYAYLGQRLRELQIPAWNPYFSSGSPAAGDAEGGWMYLPAMIAFTLFSAATAMKAMVLAQTLIGGLATYLFGRRLGLWPLAALFAAASLAVGPALYDATGQSTVIGQISAWLPVGMLGAEAAVGAARWPGRLAWSGLCGVAVVEMFAAWPQGCLYGGILIAAWLAYRGLVAPHGARRTHLIRAGMAGGVALAFAVTIGAAAILPRLDFSAQSTIPGGDYSHLIGADYAAQPFAWLKLLGLFLESSLNWRITELSGVIVLLGLLATVLGGRHYGIPFFAGATLIMLDLAAAPSLTRGAFYLLPFFKQLDSHRPSGSMYMVDLPVAMLAGAGVQLVLAGHRPRFAWLRCLLPLAILLVAIEVLNRTGSPVSHWQSELAIVATGLIVLATIRLPKSWPWLRPRLPQLIAIGLLGLSLLYPTGRDFYGARQQPTNYINNWLSDNPTIQQATDTLLARQDPGTAAALLQYLQTTEPPFRYAAYFGTGSPDSPRQPSTALRLQPAELAILANGRSAMLGLEQISGYNPLHLLDYTEYVDLMNGTRQNYHWLDIYAAALSSPLLDMLNVRYVLAPTDLRHPLPLPESRVIYRDNLVTVYENLNAFPRAWLVHDVRPDQNGAGLTAIDRGTVNGRQVAYVDGAISAGVNAAQSVDPGDDPADKVTVTELQPERLAIHVTAESAGLLVVSEPYASGWTARVDGKDVPVVRTDQALQGVPVTAGEHSVVLTYAPRSLTIGLWVTAAGLLALLAVWGWALVDWWRRRGLE